MLLLLLPLLAYAGSAPLADAVARAGSAIPKPRPELSFVVETKEQVRIAVRWDQRPDLDTKNEVRSRILWNARKAIPGEKRFLSVIFTDEIAWRGWK